MADCNNQHINRHYKSWRLTGLYVFCGLVYAAGFAVREVGAFRYDDLIIYIVSICLCFAAPYAIARPVFPSFLLPIVTSPLMIISATYLLGIGMLTRDTVIVAVESARSTSSPTTTCSAASSTTSRTIRPSTRAAS